MPTAKQRAAARRNIKRAQAARKRTPARRRRMNGTKKRTTTRRRSTTRRRMNGPKGMFGDVLEFAGQVAAITAGQYVARYGADMLPDKTPGPLKQAAPAIAGVALRVLGRKDPILSAAAAGMASVTLDTVAVGVLGLKPPALNGPRPGRVRKLKKGELDRLLAAAKGGMNGPAALLGTTALLGTDVLT